MAIIPPAASKGKKNPYDNLMALLEPKKTADHDWFLSLLDDEGQRAYEEKHMEAVMQMLRIARIRTHKNAVKEAKEEIAKLSSEIEELQLKLNKEPVITDYKDKLTVLQYALVQYTNPDENDIPESIIEAFVEKIVAKKDGFDWYLRFDGDPNDPLHLKTEGRRRQNSSVSTEMI